MNHHFVMIKKRDFEVGDLIRHVTASPNYINIIHKIDVKPNGEKFILSTRYARIDSLYTESGPGHKVTYLQNKRARGFSLADKVITHKRYWDPEGDDITYTCAHGWRLVREVKTTHSVVDNSAVKAEALARGYELYKRPEEAPSAD